MKITIIKSYLIFMLIAVATMTVAAGEESDTALLNLFRPASQSGPDAGKPVSDFVLRQRLVAVQFELMQKGASPAQELRLNLFDDTFVRAVLDNAVTGPSDSYAWIGHPAENPSDRIVLVVSETSVSGNIRAAGRYFQIRPLDRTSHLVREINTGLLTRYARLSRSMTSLESEVVELTNQERVINGLHGLSGNGQLAESSRNHSVDMATMDYFSHDSLDGRAFSDRISAAGYVYASCAENIAAGYADAEAVVNGWMNSPGHRANILNENFCDIGVGYALNADSEYRHYWTQNFGRQPHVETCPGIDDDEGDGADASEELDDDDDADTSDEVGDDEANDDDASDENETGDPDSLSQSDGGGGGSGCFIDAFRR